MEKNEKDFSVSNPGVIAIVGPTASGKSSLAIQLARKFDGEIVSADSRLVYRHMDIGTAKPSRAELALVPHHLIDIIDPDGSFSLAEFQRQVYQTVDDIQRRGKLPLLVGGTGQYFWAVVEGWVVPEVAPDLDFRKMLEDRAAKGEGEMLHRELEQVDPASATRIDSRNVRRVIRALEVARQPGGALVKLRKSPPPFETLIIGLTAERKELYHRIDERVDRMLESELVDEVKRLLDMGYKINLPSMSGIGYKQICLFLRGDLTLEEAAKQIKTETHRLVRRQYNWFRLTDSRIYWFDIAENSIAQRAGELVADFIKIEKA